MEEELGPVRAPELDGAIAWLNTPAPLTLAQLRGKIVLLDFWTYGCINCQHVLPDLQRLQAKFADVLVVIGVHAAKFDNEKSTENIRRTLQRLGIRHPVANDAEFRIWQAYTVRAWPTQVLIDPRGYVVGTATGEGHGAQLEEVITAVAAVFDEDGTLDHTPRLLTPEATAHEGMLAFPGKVLADEASSRLFIADTGHHRIVETDLQGRVQRVFGSGVAGRDYGPAESAQFSDPQGLALDGDTLWVADAGNHLIRRIDLGVGRGDDGGGDGAAGDVAAVRRRRRARDLAQLARGTSPGMDGCCSSPWPVRTRSGCSTRMRGMVIRYAGTAAEGRHDGHVDEATFAQPSGLALLGRTLYVADAEANIVRAAALPPENQIRTIAGGDLFEFGDVDGEGDAVRLQHPLGLCVDGARLLVADTYNHRIKRLDPTTGRVSSWTGAGRPGHVDGPAATARFYEPGGLSATGRHAYVADTNNHAVRVVDLASGDVQTLDIRT